MDKIQLCIQKLEGYSRWEPEIKMKWGKEWEDRKIAWTSKHSNEFKMKVYMAWLVGD